MSRFFDMVNYQFTLKMPEILLVKEFKALNSVARNRGVKGDQNGKKKLRLLKELTFIYLVADWNSPYRAYTESQKWQDALESSGLREKDIDDLVFKAIDKYKDLQKTKTMLLLEDAYEAVDKIRTYYKTVDIDERDENGRVINTAKDLITNLKNLSGVVDSLNELEEAIQKELSNKSNLRANAKKGRFD